MNVPNLNDRPRYTKKKVLTKNVISAWKWWMCSSVKVVSDRDERRLLMNFLFPITRPKSRAATAPELLTGGSSTMPATTNRAATVIM